MAGALRIRSPKALEGLKKSGAAAPSVDTYLTKLVKMIPGEAQSAYALGGSLIKGDGTKPYLLGWMVVCAIIAIVVRWVGTADKPNKEGPDYVHIVLSLLAFIVWIYAATELFSDWPNATVYKFLPALLVILFTFVAPYFYKGSES